MRGKLGFFAGTQSVALLLHFDGSNAATTTVDSSPFNRTVTLNGDAVISTTQSKFGGSSLLLDGVAGNAASVAGQLNVRQLDFTVDAWIYLDDAESGSFAMVCEIGYHNGNYPNNDGVGLHLQLTDGDWFPAYFFGDTASPFGGYQAVGTEAITPGQWTHLAWSRQSTTMRMFVDGVEAAEEVLSDVSDIVAANDTVTVGGNAFDDAGLAFAGHIDELRIVVGKAEYTANFTPPTAAYT